MAGEYWIGQVPDLLAVVRPREAVDSGFESWHSSLLVGKMTALYLSFTNLCSSSIAMRRWPDCQAC